MVRQSIGISMFMGIVALVAVLSARAESVSKARPAEHGVYDPIPRVSLDAQQPIAKPEGRVGSMGLVAGSTIETGVIEGWPESGPPFEFDSLVTVDSDIVAWWSINTLDPDRGWFYAYLPPDRGCTCDRDQRHLRDHRCLNLHVYGLVRRPRRRR